MGVAVQGLDGAWRVQLYSDDAPIDYVRILLFDDFAQLVQPDALNAPPLASLNTAPAPSPELAAKIEALHPAHTYTGASGRPAAAATRADSPPRRKPTAASSQAASPKPRPPSPPLPRPALERAGEDRGRVAAEESQAQRRVLGRHAAAREPTVRSRAAVRVVGPLDWLGCPALICALLSVAFATVVRFPGGLQLARAGVPAGAGLRLGGDPAVDAGARSCSWRWACSWTCSGADRWGSGPLPARPPTPWCWRRGT